MSHHVEIVFDPPLPAPYASPTAWAKCDIVLTVAFHRLRYLFFKADNGRRAYDIRVLSPAVFSQVQQAVRAGLGL
jgi:uncharacterized protein YifN (PemK superfamily)